MQGDYSQQTPTSKLVAKRSADEIERAQHDESGTQASTSKVQKLIEVKKEKFD